MQVLAPSRLFTGYEIIEGVSLKVQDGRVVDIARRRIAG